VSVFADTSAIYSLLVRTESEHEEVVRTFRGLIQSGHDIVTTNYVLVETVALLQRRLGIEAVRDFQERLMPLFRVHWVAEALHRRAMTRLLQSDQARVSFVDRISFAFMQANGIREAFALDRHFAAAGYTLHPSGSGSPG
jgi:predicted nucleic acid-binding protein